MDCVLFIFKWCMAFPHFGDTSKAHVSSFKCLPALVCIPFELIRWDCLHDDGVVLIASRLVINMVDVFIKYETLPLYSSSELSHFFLVKCTSELVYHTHLPVKN